MKLLVMMEFQQFRRICKYQGGSAYHVRICDHGRNHKRDLASCWARCRADRCPIFNHKEAK